jgi:hypothetical protein
VLLQFTNVGSASCVSRAETLEACVAQVADLIAGVNQDGILDLGKGNSESLSPAFSASREGGPICWALGAAEMNKCVADSMNEPARLLIASETSLRSGEKNRGSLVDADVSVSSTEINGGHRLTAKSPPCFWFG